MVLNVQLSDTEQSSVMNSSSQNGSPEIEKAVKLDQAQLMATRPNGGVKAWLQVVCGFFLFFNTYGLINTFGVYQTYYTAELNFSPSLASLIGGIETFLVLFGGAFAGPLYDAGYTRFLIITGAALIVFGTMMQSLGSQYWHFILAESLCIGIGGGMIGFLAPTVLSTYFTTLYPLTVGIAASGTGIAGIILPVVFRELEPRLGFPWAVRIIGFILLVTLLVPVLFLQPRMVAGKTRKAIDKTAFRDWPFVVFLMGNFIYLLGGFTPFFYVQVYGIEKNITDATFSFYIISIMNATSAVARIVPNFLSPYVGPFNILLASGLLTFVFAFSFIGASSVAALTVVSALYGGASGLFFALQPVIVIGLSPDPKLFGTRLGMAFGVISFAVLVSNPIAGAIQVASGGYLWIWLWTGLTTGVGAIIMAIARLMKTDWKFIVTS